MPGPSTSPIETRVDRQFPNPSSPEPFVDLWAATLTPTCAQLCSCCLEGTALCVETRKDGWGTSSTERTLAMTEQHLSLHVPNKAALVGTGSDSSSSQLFLGLAGSVG